MKKTLSLALVITTVASTAFCASEVNRPSGIRLGKRMTLRPYVSMSYTFDSNIDHDHTERAGSIWIVSPAMDMIYKSDNWDVSARAWYDYHAYEGYHKQLNASSYGETFSLKWNDKNPKGWNLVLTERYQKISQDDDLSNHGGRGLGRDRQLFTVDSVLGHRFTEKIHASVAGGYYYLDYDNSQKSYGTLYGWRRALAGGEVGYAFSKWFDFLISGSYQWYWQDNFENKNVWDTPPNTTSEKLANNSSGYTVSTGIGSHLTERISYRALLGWSRFEYAKGLSNRDNVTYSLSANWKASDTLSIMLLGSSYYQPSEVYYGSSMMVSTIGLGVGKSLVRGKLSATLDLTYRHEETQYQTLAGTGFDEDIITGRVGLNYNINRFVSLFGRVEYQTTMTSGQYYGSIYDYDRFRGTLGLRLSY